MCSTRIDIRLLWDKEFWMREWTRICLSVRCLSSTPGLATAYYKCFYEKYSVDWNRDTCSTCALLVGLKSVLIVSLGKSPFSSCIASISLNVNSFPFMWQRWTVLTSPYWWMTRQCRILEAVTAEGQYGLMILNSRIQHRIAVWMAKFQEARVL
jgi:hypothetical protein